MDNTRNDKGPNLMEAIREYIGKDSISEWSQIMQDYNIPDIVSEALENCSEFSPNSEEIEKAAKKYTQAIISPSERGSAIENLNLISNWLFVK